MIEPVLNTLKRAILSIFKKPSSKERNPFPNWYPLDTPSQIPSSRELFSSLSLEPEWYPLEKRRFPFRKLISSPFLRSAIRQKLTHCKQDKKKLISSAPKRDVRRPFLKKSWSALFRNRMGKADQFPLEREWKRKKADQLLSKEG